VRPELVKPRMPRASQARAATRAARVTAWAGSSTSKKAEREGTTATTVKRFIEAHRRAAERGREADTEAAAEPRTGTQARAAYAGLGHPGGQQEVTHEPA